VVTLSAVVPATDLPVTLERCLDAIARADLAPDEVVVVEHPSELSAAGARNAGVRRASGEVIVFVDADVEVHRDAFVGIRAAYAADPALAAVYGSYDDSPSAPTTVSAFRNLLHHHVHQRGAGPADTFWTGLGAVRRATFLDIGGFDEARYPHPSVEDIEFGRRLSDAGQPILLDPTIQGTHLKAWTLRSMIWTDFARRGIPWVALECRQRRLSSSLNLGWRHRLSAAACVIGLAAAVLSRFSSALIALAVLVALNRSFYAVLLRRQGLVRAFAGVGLHAMHHLVAVAAVPAGVAAALGTSAMTGWSRRRVAAPIASDEASLVE
jgi:GT2 family glycosyltransferase